MHPAKSQSMSSKDQRDSQNPTAPALWLSHRNAEGPQTSGCPKQSAELCLSRLQMSHYRRSDLLQNPVSTDGTLYLRGHGQLLRGHLRSTADTFVLDSACFFGFFFLCTFFCTHCPTLSQVGQGVISRSKRSRIINASTQPYTYECSIVAQTRQHFVSHDFIGRMTVNSRMPRLTQGLCRENGT